MQSLTEVNLLGALARKYPNAGRELGWQYLFPASRLHPLFLSAYNRRLLRSCCRVDVNPRIPAVIGGE
jgi:hypothetical protein